MFPSGLAAPATATEWLGVDKAPIGLGMVQVGLAWFIPCAVCGRQRPPTALRRKGASFVAQLDQACPLAVADDLWAGVPPLVIECPYRMGEGKQRTQCRPNSGTRCLPKGPHVNMCAHMQPQLIFTQSSHNCYPPDKR